MWGDAEPLHVAIGSVAFYVPRFFNSDCLNGCANNGIQSHRLQYFTAAELSITTP